MQGSLQTPIMMAVLGGHVHIVKALLELNADVTIPEKDGYTPMHGAGFQGRAEIAAVLMNHGVPTHGTVHNDGYLPFHRACWGKDLRHAQTVRAFINAGVDPNIRAGNGATCSAMTQNTQTKIILSDYEKSKAKLNDEL